MYYTYAHIRLDTNAIFYIGKGIGRRLNKKDNRNKYWKHIVEKHGFKAIKLSEWDNESDAYSHEKSLITYLRNKGIKLVNVTDGGDGNNEKGGFTFKGRKQSKEAIEKTMAFVRGIPKSKESKLKNAEAHKQAIKINNIVYDSWLKASNILGIPMGSLNHILKGLHSKNGKYSWINSCELVM
jgi:hypothetical protein